MSINSPHHERFTNHYFSKGLGDQDRSNNNVRVSKVRNRKIILKYDFHLRKIIIPPAGLFSSVSFHNIFKIVLFSIFIFCFNYLKKQLLYEKYFFNNIILQLSNIILNLIVIFLAICLAILWFKFLLDILGKMTLTVDRQDFSVTYSLFGIKNKKSLIIPLQNIIRIEKYQLESNKNSHLEIITEGESYTIFSNPHFPVTSTEIDRLGNVISNWLNAPLKEIPSLTEPELKNAICYIEQLSCYLEQKDC